MKFKMVLVKAERSKRRAEEEGENAKLSIEKEREMPRNQRKNRCGKLGILLLNSTTNHGF